MEKASTTFYNLKKYSCLILMNSLQKHKIYVMQYI